MLIKRKQITERTQAVGLKLWGDQSANQEVLVMPILTPTWAALLLWFWHFHKNLSADKIPLKGKKKPLASCIGPCSSKRVKNAAAGRKFRTLPGKSRGKDKTKTKETLNSSKNCVCVRAHACMHTCLLKNEKHLWGKGAQKLPLLLPSSDWEGAALWFVVPLSSVCMQTDNSISSVSLLVGFGTPILSQKDAQTDQMKWNEG